MHRLAILYLVLPVMVWLVGWFHWWFGIPAALVLAIALRKILLPAWRLPAWRAAIAPATGALLLVALVFVMATAAGGVFDTANYNWDRNRALFLDLSRNDWPVYFTTYLELPLLLRYYLGYYIVPGLMGKWLGAAALTWAVPLWTWCGTALALLLFARSFRGWPALAAILILMLFGMLDHLVPSMGIAGYGSQLRHLAVSPQHFLPGVLYTLLLIQLRHREDFLGAGGVVLATSLLWSAFIAVGLLPLIGALLYQKGFRPFLRWQNLIAAPPLALLLALYVASGSAHYPHGLLWARYGWERVIESGAALSAVSFLALALLIMFLQPRLRREPLLLVCLVSFPLALCYTYGYDVDWSRHVTLPALVVLYYCVAETVVRGWGDYRGRYARGALALVVVVLVGGSIPPTVSYLSDASESRDLRVLRYERIERHDTLLTAVEPQFLDNHVTPATAWQQFLLRDSGPTVFPDKGKLIIEADYAVYLKDKRLVYVRPRCEREEVESRFILHIVPVDEKILAGRESINQDFYFTWNGLRIVDTCIAVQDLPEYDIASFTTGQYRGGHTPTGHRWLATYHMAAE